MLRRSLSALTSSKPFLRFGVSQRFVNRLMPGNVQYIPASAAPETETQKKLFTPGPLEVSYDVKCAMLKDLGHRDAEFGNAVKFIRRKLLDIAGVTEDQYTTVPMQGSGTFAVESVLGTTISRENGKIFVITNGAYGKRIARMVEMMGFENVVLEGEENARAELRAIRHVLSENKDITSVIMVHCETSTGVIHPVEEVGKAVKEFAPNADFIVDAMSSFGGIPLDPIEANISFLISSANKCLEGVPGFAYVIGRKERLLECEGRSKSLSLDLFDQYLTLERTGLFRFTAPTHTILAFKQALIEYDEEGGLKGRAARYRRNCSVVKAGMKKMGFREFLDDSHENYIITSFYYPNDPNFSFEEFDARLGTKGQGIYPGQVSKAPCFRIGNIGQLYPDDMRCLLNCIREALAEMNVKLPLK